MFCHVVRILKRLNSEAVFLCEMMLRTSPMSDLVFHRALRARRATFSNVSSPVSRLSVANSRMKVPTPAVQVTGVSVGLTPCSRFTVPYGMPVAVWNATIIYTTCQGWKTTAHGTGPVVQCCNTHFQGEFMCQLFSDRKSC